MSVRSRAPRFRLRHPSLIVAALATLHCTAQAQNAANTLKEVTVSSEQDVGYAPSISSTATKGSAPLRDIPQAVNVLPAQLLRDQGATSMQDALRSAPGVSFNAGDGQRDQVVILRRRLPILQIDQQVVLGHCRMALATMSRDVARVAPT